MGGGSNESGQKKIKEHAKKKKNQKSKIQNFFLPFTFFGSTKYCRVFGEPYKRIGDSTEVGLRSGLLFVCIVFGVVSFWSALCVFLRAGGGGGVVVSDSFSLLLISIPHMLHALSPH